MEFSKILKKSRFQKKVILCQSEDLYNYYVRSLKPVSILYVSNN